mmetsp:Transcript_1434/g.2033  ORF Transcript_1434/g.2033 Transcript_1434/m.2033 type:complete len:293 (-) Transcript_1434:183-1061(-)
MEDSGISLARTPPYQKPLAQFMSRQSEISMKNTMSTTGKKFQNPYTILDEKEHILRVKTALKEIEEFVVKTCGDRPPSHSDQHMRDVVERATDIYVHERNDKKLDRYLDPLYFILCVVCWLHDVADHKYTKKNPSLSNELASFLLSFTTKYFCLVKGCEYEHLFNPEKISAITERFSFSREKKLGEEDWLEAIGKEGILIRNYGSDADKLLAIGRFGIIRCAQYSLERAGEKKEKIDNVELARQVTEHYHEKLKLLSTQYMRTDRGKEIASKLDEEMLNTIKELEAGKLHLE